MMLLLQAIHLRHNWLTRNRGGEIRIQNWRKKLKKPTQRIETTLPIRSKRRTSSSNQKGN